MINQKKLSEALREFRIRKDMTQDQVAKRIGISRPVLSQIENMNQIPTTRHLTLIRDRLGIDINQFMDEEGTKTGVSEPRPYFGEPFEIPKDVAAIASMVNDAKEVRKDLFTLIKLLDQLQANEDHNLTLNQIKLIGIAKEIANRCMMTL